jgi:hypothetical protein
MKPIATQYVECVDLLKANGVTPEQIAEAVKGTVSEEHKLSVVLSLKKKHNIKESQSRKIDRKNGGCQDFSEANTTMTRDERVLHFMGESYHLNYREACYMIGERPERDAKQPASITEAIIAKWKAYLPCISAQDARTLAERGVQP